MRFQQADLFDGPIPPGTYRATVESIREARSRNGNPMVVVSLRVDHEWATRREAIDYLVTAGAGPEVTTPARRRLASLCRSCGFDPRPNEDFDLACLTQRAVEIDLTVEAGTRGPWNRVLAYRPLSAGPARTL